MKTACIYHRIDLDGWVSAAIVNNWWEEETKMQEGGKRVDTIEFIGYNYGDPLPELQDFDQIIMVDVSFPKEVMIDLWTRLGLNFIWCDHHISSIKEMENAHESMVAYPIQGIRDVNFAACELAWMHFFSGAIMPEFVRLLGRYDCFGHKGTPEEQTVLEFQYGARGRVTNYEDAFTIIQAARSTEKYIYQVYENEMENIKTAGKAVYEHLCTNAKQIYARAFPVILVEHMTKEAARGLRPEDIDSVELDGSVNVKRKFLAVNQERFNPVNFGIDYHADGYAGFLCFHMMANTQWAFSFYNDDGKTDCSIIAKSFGGGGHKGAAGCIKKNITDVLNIR